MSGIAAFFARESVPDYKYIDMLFKGIEKRGQDGFGFSIVKNKGSSFGERIGYNSRTVKSYSEDIEDSRESFYRLDPSVGEVIIAASKSASEMEPDVDDPYQLIQPIVRHDHGIVMVHDGSVSRKIHDEIVNQSDQIDFKYQTDMESESIIAAYLLAKRDMKIAMEYLSGGFAIIMFDELQNRLYLVNDYKPLAWGYIRGIGLFVCSDVEPIADIVHEISGVERCGISLWEDFYYHPISGPRIQSIDLDSGFVRKEKYSPRYMTQNWDSNGFGGIE